MRSNQINLSLHGLVSDFIVKVRGKSSRKSLHLSSLYLSNVKGTNETALICIHCLNQCSLVGAKLLC